MGCILQHQSLDNLLGRGVVVKLLVELAAVTVGVLLLLLLLARVADHRVAVQLGQAQQHRDHLATSQSAVNEKLTNQSAVNECLTNQRPGLTLVT